MIVYNFVAFWKGIAIWKRKRGKYLKKYALTTLLVVCFIPD